jgi:hypothetical protein
MRPRSPSCTVSSTIHELLTPMRHRHSCLHSRAPPPPTATPPHAAPWSALRAIYTCTPFLYNYNWFRKPININATNKEHGFNQYIKYAQRRNPSGNTFVDSFKGDLTDRHQQQRPINNYHQPQLSGTPTETTYYACTSKSKGTTRTLKSNKLG